MRSAFGGSLLVLMLGLVAACADHAADGDRGPEVGRGERAISGRTSDTLDVAVVGIQDDTTGAQCTGALIAPNLVLTAQHCVAPIVGTPDCATGSFGPAAAPRPAST